MKYENFLGNQQALAEANARLNEYAQARQNQQNATDEAWEQYFDAPQGLLAKALATGGGAALGAGVGAGLGNKVFGSSRFGAVLGGVAGLGAGSGIGIPLINNSLDAKHPERVELRKNVNEAHAHLDEAHRRYNDHRGVYDRSLAHNAQAALDNPAYYQRAVNELGPDYPMRDINTKMGHLERQTHQQQALAEEARKEELRNQQLQNQLLKEELIKQKTKNEMRRSGMGVEKEAFTAIRHDMEKISQYFG